MIEDGLFAALKNDAAISEKVQFAGGYHIYPLRLPPGVNLSGGYAITYTEISQANTYPLVKQSLFQISAFGDTFDKARALAADIENALNDLSAAMLGGKYGVVYVKLAGRHALYDDAAKLYYFVLEILIKH